MRRLAYAAVFILGLLFCGWRAIIWYAERTTLFAGALLPTCGAMVSGEYAADRERQIPACPSTRFRIASISKTLTAAAMARLHEQGRLDLDAILANLGHAKFPFARLMGIVNPFLAEAS